jgi:hypothetical protein
MRWRGIVELLLGVLVFKAVGAERMPWQVKIKRQSANGNREK